ncbi:MAG: hypothetical protein L0Y73_03735 [Candidatus Aminicenantes bacterium]|nr:hypothetical protein [Candidatus Aminicenantes bacterium]
MGLTFPFCYGKKSRDMAKLFETGIYNMDKIAVIKEKAAGGKRLSAGVISLNKKFFKMGKIYG